MQLLTPARLIAPVVLTALTATMTLNMQSPEAARATPDVLALTGAKIYTSPDEAPIANGVVVIRAGKIVTVGKAQTVSLPADAHVIDCTGLVITAGFQNSHVHFAWPKWQDAQTQPAEAIARGLVEMLTRYGFTTVVDTGSSLANTKALRHRIDAGEVPGPRILTAGEPLYPQDGLPFYLRDLPPAVLQTLRQPATADEAAEAVRQGLAGGADVVKLFTGSLLTPTQVKPMSLESAQAAVAEAHRQGRLVFTHPSNLEGIEVALAAGVDVLAHTTPNSPRWDDKLVAAMTAKDLTLIPTLQLWRYETIRQGRTAEFAERFTETAVGQLKAFAEAGGRVLFGTDVGYMTDYDPTQEYALMARAGLSSSQILISLTTAPADRFGEKNRRGRVAAGMDADIVVLAADPANDVRNFAKVRYTIRNGRVIFALH